MCLLKPREPEADLMGSKRTRIVPPVVAPKVAPIVAPIVAPTVAPTVALMSAHSMETFVTTKTIAAIIQTLVITTQIAALTNAHLTTPALVSLRTLATIARDHVMCATTTAASASIS